MGKWQPTCVKRMTLGMNDRLRTYAFKAAFTLPALFLVIGMMALRLIFIIVVLWFALGSVQVAVLGFSPSESLPACSLSALVNDENSSRLVLLCRAFYALICSGLPSAPLPKAFCFSRAQFPALSVISSLIRSSAFPPLFNFSLP